MITWMPGPGRQLPDATFLAHGGLLTGHWEFDLAILATFLAVVSYSFLLPADAPQGKGRWVILGITGAFALGAVTLAAIGLRSL